jgi:hypothetical protein
MGQPRWPETIGPLIIRFKSPIRRIGMETRPVNAAIAQVKSIQNHMSGNATTQELERFKVQNGTSGPHRHWETVMLPFGKGQQ